MFIRCSGGGALLENATEGTRSLIVPGIHWAVDQIEKEPH